MSLLLDTLKLSDASIDSASAKPATIAPQKKYDSGADLNLDLQPVDTDAISLTQTGLLNKKSTFDADTISNSSINSNTDDLSGNAENTTNLNSLISRVNSHRHRQKRIARLAISFILLFILSTTAAYLFIESTLSRQTLFIFPVENIPNSVLHDSQVTTDNFNLAKIIIPLSSQALTADHSDSLPTEAPLMGTTNKTDPIDKSIKNIMTKNQPPAIPLTKGLTKKSPAEAFISSPKKPDIHITYKTISDPVHLLLSRAYTFFQAGKYFRSQKLYQQVISSEPKNRNALLGIAAIAIKNQNFELAQQKYIFLLQLNPKDSLAISGLNSIQNNNHSQSTESQLKFMLKHQPDAAHLHFSLGSLYAYRHKWQAAQSAFFNAWSFDNTNADYCYNLAVSLDHLKQHRQAVKFYRLSLTLTQSIAANFSFSDTQQRIMTLQERLK